MVILRKCCFCCQLTTGVIALGWFISISAVFMAIRYIFCLIKHRNILDFLEDGKYDLDFSTAFKVRHGAGATLNILGFFIAELLIIGAKKRKVQYLFLFLIFYMFYIVISLIIALTVVFTSDTGAIIYLLLVVIIFVWEIYWWLCVLSLYQEIKEEEEVRPGDTMRQNQPNVVI